RARLPARRPRHRSRPQRRAGELRAADRAPRAGDAAARSRRRHGHRDASRGSRMSETMIEVEDFSFSHSGSGAWQLQRVATHIARGEKVAVMGATGAGKSTFAMALNGLIPH